MFGQRLLGQTYMGSEVLQGPSSSLPFTLCDTDPRVSTCERLRYPLDNNEGKPRTESSKACSAGPRLPHSTLGRRVLGTGRVPGRGQAGLRRARGQPCQSHTGHCPRLLPDTITAVKASRSWGPSEHPLLEARGLLRALSVQEIREVGLANPVTKGAGS